MSATDHPLTEDRAAEMWDTIALDFDTMTTSEMTRPKLVECVVAAERAAFDAGREHEREHADPHHDPRPWRDCTREDIRKGDLVGSRVRGVLRVAVAHHQNENGDWLTEGGCLLTYGPRYPLRRIPAPTPPAEEVEMPGEFRDVILNPRWGVRSYTRAVHLGEGVWAAEVTPGADVYTHLARDLRSATLPDGTRARRDGERENGEPRFVKAQDDEA